MKWLPKKVIKTSHVRSSTWYAKEKKKRGKENRKKKREEKRREIITGRFSASDEGE